MQVTEKKEACKQHSLPLSVFLHLFPGVLVTICYALFTPTLNQQGILSILSFLIWGIIMIIPFGLGYLLVLGWIGETGAQSSASYDITRSVMSGGGATSTSASYSLTGTFGQPSPVQASDSASYSLGSGFWGATVKLFTVAIQNISYNIAEGARITWHSIADASYTIQFADSLRAAWTELSTLTGTGGLMEWLDDGTETGSPPTAAGILKRFYRLRGQP